MDNTTNNKRDPFTFSIIGVVLGIAYSQIVSWYYGYDSALYYFKDYHNPESFNFWLMVIPTVGIFLFLIAISDQKNKGDYGSASWAKSKDIKKMKLFAKTGVIFGLWGKKIIRTDKPLSAIIAAPPGTGKTNMVAIPNLLSCNYSMLVNDVKNELYEQTAKHRAKYQKVIRFAPAEEGSAHWNPFNDMPNKFREQLSYIERITNSLYPLANNEEKDHWPRGARSVFNFFAMLAAIDDINNVSMPTIRTKILETDDIQAFVAEFIDEFEHDDVEVLRYMTEASNKILQINSREFGSISSAASAPLEVFSHPVVRENLSKSDFSITDLRNNKITIYLCTSTDDFERVQPITRLFIELAANQLLADKPKKGQEILFLLDEFVRMGKLLTLVKMPALSRSQLVIILFIVQDFVQIEALYGKPGRTELMTTTAYKLAFTQNEHSAMKEVSDFIGPRTVEKVSTNQQAGWFKPKNKSVSNEAQPLILPQDIGSLTDDQVIITAQGFAKIPIMAKTCKWFEHPQMKKLVNE